jgi:hypothetical protein
VWSPSALSRRKQMLTRNTHNRGFDSRFLRADSATTVFNQQPAVRGENALLGALEAILPYRHLWGTISARWRRRQAGCSLAARVNKVNNCLCPAFRFAILWRHVAGDAVTDWVRWLAMGWPLARRHSHFRGSLGIRVPNAREQRFSARQCLCGCGGLE